MKLFFNNKKNILVSNIAVPYRWRLKKGTLKIGNFMRICVKIYQDQFLGFLKKKCSSFFLQKFNPKVRQEGSKKQSIYRRKKYNKFNVFILIKIKIIRIFRLYLYLLNYIWGKSFRQLAQERMLIFVFCWKFNQLIINTYLLK